MPHVDINELKEGRKSFTKEEWMDVLLRSIGMEPDTLTEREKWLLLLRMVPLVENNFNLCELGPRSTGKSHLYKEISPNSILVSGGQTTVANLFYNMARKTVGLVGLWDCVAFDEVAGIDFKNQDSIQILKDYMASGSFARGASSISAEASIVFVGNIDNGCDSGYMGRRLFEPFPASFNRDSAFFDRIHYYIPGWEIPKMRRDIIAKDFGWISDYFAEFCKEMRRYDYSDKFEQYFTLNSSCNIRDEVAIKKTFSGLAKLLFPGMELSRNECMFLLQYAIEGRKRVKKQLAEMAIEFADEDLGFEEKT
jgi:ATP-dependent Lon protease